MDRVRGTFESMLDRLGIRSEGYDSHAGQYGGRPGNAYQQQPYDPAGLPQQYGDGYQQGTGQYQNTNYQDGGYQQQGNYQQNDGNYQGGGFETSYTGSMSAVGARPKGSSRSAGGRGNAFTGFFGRLIGGNKQPKQPPQQQFYDPQYTQPYQVQQQYGQQQQQFYDQQQGQYDPQQQYQQQQQQPYVQPNNVIPIANYEMVEERYQPPDTRQAFAQATQQPVYEEPAPQAPPMVQMPAVEPEKPARQPKTMIYLIRRLEDTEEIIENMLSGGNVIINMEEIDDKLKRRVLDMIAGAAFALAATIRQISQRNYLIAPEGEEIFSNTNARDREREMEEGGYRSRERDRDRDRRYY